MNVGAIQAPSASSMPDMKRQDAELIVISPQDANNNTYDTDDAGQGELEKAVHNLNKTAEIYSHDVKFSVHEESHRIVVQVLRKGTEEVITEVPPRLILDMVAQFQEMVGLLVDKRV